MATRDGERQVLRRIKLTKVERKGFELHFHFSRITEGTADSELRSISRSSPTLSKIARDTGRNEPSGRYIRLPPGTRLGWLLGLLMTKRAYRRYVYPVITDLQNEYFEELAAGRMWRARWAVVRGYILLVPGWMYGLILGALSRKLRPR